MCLVVAWSEACVEDLLPRFAYLQHTEHGKSLKSRILHLYGEETARHIRLFKKLRISYSEENIQHTEHGESLKSRIIKLFLLIPFYH